MEKLNDMKITAKVKIAPIGGYEGYAEVRHRKTNELIYREYTSIAHVKHVDAQEAANTLATDMQGGNY